VNFGDVLSGDVLRHISGRPVEWSRPNRAEVFGIGSIIQIALVKAQPGALILGSGIREPLKSLPVDLEVNIQCVRGSLTVQQLGLHHEVQLGDPGLLASQLYSGRGVRPKSGFGFVPHFQDLQVPRGRRALAAIRRAGFRIILPTWSPRRVIEELRSLDFVASVGLHGLVVADSLGVPSLRVASLSGRSEPGFKYQDYESAFGVSASELTPPIDPGALVRDPRAAQTKAQQRLQRLSRRIPRLTQQLTLSMESALR
jgi:pyruvyltransferase